MIRSAGGDRPMRIYQFIPLAAVKVMRRMMGSMPPGTVAVLDLEDGNLDVGNPTATVERRGFARGRFRELCDSCGDAPIGTVVALRVNAIGTEEFDRDIAVARLIDEALGLGMVLLPKVAAASDVEAAFERLRRGGVAGADVIPMIETERGLERVSEIAAAASGLGATSVIYGAYDYALDAGFWPFPSSRDKTSWDVVERIAPRVIAAGMRYVHPPPAELQDARCLGDVVDRLCSLYGESFDMLSIGMAQATILRRLHDGDRGVPLPLIDHVTHSTEARLAMAVEVCRLHEENRRQRHSFSVDARQGRFISPHEYQAAAAYLREHGDA